MIATHIPKMFNARVKSNGIVSSLSDSLPDHLICSKTTAMRRVFWAAPSNAADMTAWQKKAAELQNEDDLDRSLPNYIDQQTKQILLPINDDYEKYVSVSPVPNAGLLHEVYRRLQEQDLPYKKWVIQPTSAALANHGEALMLQSGAVLMLRRGPAKISQGSWTGNFVQMTARCERMNISAGMMSLGFPAITGIGGLVHAIERQVGHAIYFAFGLQNVQWIYGVQKQAVNHTSYGSTPGRVKGGKVTPKPGYSTEEITANAKVVLLLKSDGDSEALMTALRKITRLAGGSLFDVEVAEVEGGAPPVASYLIDASADIIRQRQQGAKDSLQAALDMYGLDGEWQEEGGKREWFQYRNGYTLNNTGYGYLEAPQERNNARGNYPHAWAEGTFSLITQGSMSENAWWSRTATNEGVFWKVKD